MRSIKAIIFDLDGVILDSEYEYLKVIYNFLRTEGLDVKIEDLYPVVGISWEKHYQYLSKLYPKYVSPKEVKGRFEIYEKNVDYNYRQWIFPNVHKSLILLKNQFKLGLASNTKRKRLDYIVELLELKPYFEIVLSSDDVFEGKPNPEIYLLAAEKLGVLPEECLVVEDSKSGIEAANKAGMLVVAKRDRRFNLDQSLANYIIDDFPDLLEILKRDE